MKNFKDRQAEKNNQRRLKVIDLTKDENGEIIEIIADITRHEGEVLEDGTPINAESLNALVEGIKYLQEIFFEQYFLDTANSLNVSWTQNKGINKTKTFRINLGNTRFYGKVLIDHGYLNGSVTNNVSYIDVKISETASLNNTTGSSTKAYTFYVELYADANFTKYATKIKGTVNYTNMSTNPLD